jgi:hypothetical protein
MCESHLITPTCRGHPHICCSLSLHRSETGWALTVTLSHIVAVLSVFRLLLNVVQQPDAKLDCPKLGYYSLATTPGIFSPECTSLLSDIRVCSGPKSSTWVHQHGRECLARDPQPPTVSEVAPLHLTTRLQTHFTPSSD